MYGRDSRLEFTAPATGTYFVQLTDTRGQSGPHYAYRLTVAAPDPDFDLFVTPTNPNVPRGGRVPVTVTAYRKDGLDAPIDVELTGLPQGLTATRGTILPGEATVALTLTADPGIEAVTTPLRATGRAKVGGRLLTRDARTDERVALVTASSPPDVQVVSVEPALIELQPGGRAKVRATISRANGFGGRVPLSVLNLPFRVTVPDIGLNGILITEVQDSREFWIVADEQAVPVEQTLYVNARVETNQSPPSDHTSTPVRIRVVAKDTKKSEQ
jgi:hypothetical protein